MSNRITIAAALAACLGLAAEAWSAEIFYRRDDKGVIHFSAKPGPGFRPFAELERETAPRPEPETKAAPADKGRAPTHLRFKRGNDFDRLILEHARRHRVDPALVKAMIAVESGFRPTAVSHAGARGLMQLLPTTAKSYGVTNLEDPAENVRAGVTHLRWLLDRFGGDVTLAIAGYNAGGGAVRRYGGIPPYRETRNYVKKVLNLRTRFVSKLEI